MNKTIVIVPGFAMTRRSCIPAFKPLAKTGFNVVIPNIKFKKAPSREQSLDNYVTELHEHLITAHNKDFQLVGISLGGLIGMRLAARYPDLPISKLILIDPAGYNDKNRFNLGLRILRMGMRMLVEPKARRHFVLMGWDFMVETLTNLQHVWLSTEVGTTTDIEPTARAIKIPTTILWGDRDGVIDVSCGHKLHEQIPHSEFHMVKGIHSWVHYSVEQLLPYLD